MFHILLVEDNYQLLRSYTRILQDAGYEVCATTTHHAALDMFRRFKHFSLCISDLTVGGYNPMMLIRDLYSMRQLSGTPILMMSSEMDHYRLVCEESSLPYIAKPFTHAVFLERVQALVKPLAQSVEIAS